MVRNSSLIVAGIVLIAILGFSGWQLSMKSRYDKLREDVLSATQFTLSPMDDDAEGFLDSVTQSWKLQSQETPDSVFGEISAMTGVEESVAGVETLYTHEIPKYSFVNLQRNAKESVIAATMAIALPISVDGRIYVKEGVAYIKLNEKCVEVFEDTQDGLSRSLYIQQNEDEVDDTDYSAPTHDRTQGKQSGTGPATENPALLIDMDGVMHRLSQSDAEFLNDLVSAKPDVDTSDNINLDPQYRVFVNAIELALEPDELILMHRGGTKIWRSTGVRARVLLSVETK